MTQTRRCWRVRCPACSNRINLVLPPTMRVADINLLITYHDGASLAVGFRRKQPITPPHFIHQIAIDVRQYGFAKRPLGLAIFIAAVVRTRLRQPVLIDKFLEHPLVMAIAHAKKISEALGVRGMNVWIDIYVIRKAGYERIAP